MFNAIGEKTLYVDTITHSACTPHALTPLLLRYIFGAANIITIPMVWALYPETNQRTLEEIDLLFEADSPWVWDAEKHFANLLEENPNRVLAASRGNSVVDPEAGMKKADHAETQSEERQEVAHDEKA